MVGIMRVKSRHVVKPIEATWNGILGLSELDQIDWIIHTPCIYFYKTPSSQDWFLDNKTINTLKDSLSRVLVPFYPLAGRLHWINGQVKGRLELECNAMGADLIEVECSEPMTWLGDLTSCQAYKDLLPRVDYGTKPLEELPLFLVQLTRFQCGGLSLGLSMNHAVVDGLSTSHFFQEWARLARGHPIQTLPYLDRQILQAKKHQSPACREESSPYPTLIGKENDSEERRKKVVATMLTLSKSQVQKLKNIANTGLGVVGGYQYSRFEAVAAYIWRCACKARGHKIEQPTALSFSVDARPRMDPPLPPSFVPYVKHGGTELKSLRPVAGNLHSELLTGGVHPWYFGNAVVNVAATSRAGEVVYWPLSHACSKIREATEKVTNESVQSKIDILKTQQNLTRYQDYNDDLGGNKESVFYGNPNLAVTSWLNIPAYQLDFGWGEEIFMSPGEYETDGDIIILPGYEEKGSILVTVGLQELHMENFTRYFDGDIDVILDEFALKSRI